LLIAIEREGGGGEKEGEEEGERKSL